MKLLDHCSDRHAHKFEPFRPLFGVTLKHYILGNPLPCFVDPFELRATIGIDLLEQSGRRLQRYK